MFARDRWVVAGRGAPCRWPRWPRWRAHVFDSADPRYEYVNRAIPDDEFDSFIDRVARRVAAFDRQALMDIKHLVNRVSLPDDAEFPPQMAASGQAVARPARQGRTSKLFELGLQQRSDVELDLGEYVGRIAATDVLPSE
jgi:hypothetical protein